MNTHHIVKSSVSRETGGAEVATVSRIPHPLLNKMVPASCLGTSQAFKLWVVGFGLSD